MNEAAQNKTSLASLKQRLNEAAKVMAKKGDYAFSKYRNGEVDVTYKGKVIATGDFDSGADAWFMDIKGVKGQKSFNSPGDAIKFFMKSKLTEVDEDAPVNATGDAVDMTPGKRIPKPLKRFKEHFEGKNNMKTVREIRDLAEATRVKDTHRWNAHPNKTTMNAIAKDFKKELGTNKPYMDGVELVVGDKTVLTVKDNTSIADMKKAIAGWVAKNVKAAPGEVKVGKFNAKLPTEMKGVLGHKGAALDNPRVIIKTDVDSAKEIQKAVKGTGKFRMMKRTDHVAVYLDFKDGDELKAGMAKVKGIK